jgi:hypothetical protein
MTLQVPTFVGKTYEVRYTDLTALNAYHADARHMSYKVTEGPFTGAEGTIEYSWSEVSENVFVISWQEMDRSTVVHVDDFAKGTSMSFFTTSKLELIRLQGSLKEVSATT